MRNYLIITLITIAVLVCLYGFYPACIAKPNIQPDNICKGFTNKKPIWVADITKEGSEILLRGDSVGYFKDDIAKYIDALNRYHQVKIKLDEIKDSIAYTTVVNNTFFTQSLGTTGANWYVASVVFTLNEAKGIKGVYLNYEQGDYGGEPGLMKKDSINARFKICRNPQ